MIGINDYAGASNFFAPSTHTFVLTRCSVEVRDMSVKRFLPIVQNLVTHTNIKPATFDVLPWGSNQLSQLAQIVLHINSFTYE